MDEISPLLESVTHAIAKLQDLSRQFVTILVPVLAFAFHFVVGEVGEHIQAARLVSIGVYVVDVDEFSLVLAVFSWKAVADWPKCIRRLMLSRQFSSYCIIYKSKLIKYGTPKTYGQGVNNRESAMCNYLNTKN